MISVIIKSGNVLHSLAPTSFAPSAHEAFPVELIRRRDKNELQGFGGYDNMLELLIIVSWKRAFDALKIHFVQRRSSLSTNSPTTTPLLAKVSTGYRYCI